MLLKTQRSLFARFALIVVLLGGMLGVEPIQAVSGTSTRNYDHLPRRGAANLGSPLVGLAILGDSSSDEYRADDNRGGAYAATTLNWVELLTRYRDINTGQWGTRAEPRRTGYEYNWAHSGSRIADLTRQGQAAGVASQIASGKVNFVVIMSGENDFTIWNGTYEEIYNGALSDTAVQAKIDKIVSDMSAALDTLQQAGPAHILVANIIDKGSSPVYQQIYPDALKRQRVTNAILAANQGIQTAASQRGIPVLDLYHFIENVEASVDPNGYLHVGGELINTLVGDNEPHHVLLGDNIHGGTVIEGLIANEVIRRLREAHGLSIVPFTEAEILTHAGIVPTLPTFGDVPTGHAYYQYIQRVYEAGITAGCSQSPSLYCPDDPVTRAQMAVFLERAMKGSSYSPPSVGGSTGFGDVPTTHWAAAWIKQLAEDGLTSGCGNGKYCPESSVTREQMAVFLLRAKHGSSYHPPAVGNSTGFEDVHPAHWAAAWIKQLVAEGITAGCGSGNYCPEQAVTRAQMAVFLVRTFNLP